MKLKPLGDRLIVRAIEEEEKTASGMRSWASSRRSVTSSGPGAMSGGGSAGSP